MEGKKGIPRSISSKKTNIKHAHQVVEVFFLLACENFIFCSNSGVNEVRTGKISWSPVGADQINLTVNNLLN